MAANRRILIAMAMLLVAIFASISVTFAWFSTNTQATAIFNLTIRDSDDNLYIKVDGGIERERADDYAADYRRLADINYTNESGGWRLVNEAGNIASESNYIMQQYTLYTDNPTKAVFLDRVNSSVVSGYKLLAFGPTDKSFWQSRGVTNERIAQFYGTTDIDETNDTESKIVWRAGQEDETVYYFRHRGYYSSRAANAVRIAVLPESYDRLPTVAPATIWEPNKYAGYDELDENGEYIYEHISSYHKSSISGFASIDRTADSNTVDYEVNRDMAIVNQTMWRSVDRSESDYHAKVPYRANITVVMWLEGKDADCFNVIGNDTVTSNLSLVLL